MRVLFCGSRDLEGSWRIWQKLNHLALTEGTVSTTIVHGGAKGADSIADYYARKMGFTVEVYPADWTAHGRAAGPIRNKQMLDTGIDRVCAYTTNTLAESKGTANMVKIAAKAGVPVDIEENA